MKFITILQGGGGLPDLLQYYKREGGVSRDPKFVLRNIWTAPYWLTLISAVFQLLQYKTMIGPEPNNQTKELRIRTSFFFSFIRLRHINQAVFYDRTESYHGSDLF